MFDRHWATASDEELLRACRHGDADRFSLLWDRHRKAGLVAARSLAPGLDADDLVSDAYLKIFELVRDGRGPEGAFRPYLYQVIKTVAADRLRSPERATANLEEIPDLHEAGPWEDNAFDLNAVAAAFATLHPRWQAALWYTEVERMPPREAALLLGLSANSVSALAARAREALKSAWVEAHVDRELAEAECRSTLERLQRYQRGKLTARASREVGAHLEVCESCSKASAEFATLNRKLGLTLAALVLGGTGAAALFREIGAAPALLDSAADAPAAGTDGGAGAGAAAGAGPAVGAAAGAAVGTIAGVSAIAVAVIGAAVLVISNLTAANEGSGALPTPTEQTEVGSPSPDEREHGDKPDTDSDVDEAEKTEPPAETSGEPRRTLPPPPAPSLPTAPVTPPDPGPVDPGPVDPGPVDPPPPADDGDPSILVGFDCYLPGSVIVGSANEYGVIRLRAAQGASAPVELMNPLYDPADTTGATMFDPGTGLFDDGRGNTFDFGFFTGTDPDPGPYDWFGQDPSQFPAWAQSFGSLTLADVTLEMRFVTPDGRYSQWTAIDTGTTC